MPYRNETLLGERFYHIFNRTLADERLFADMNEYMLALRLIKKHVDRYSVSVIAYCLMPTHYHMILQPGEDSNLSRCLQTLFNSYVQSINKQRKRRGPLFEGRFHHVQIEDDYYLWQACRYIHLNPVHAGLVDRPEQWPYSNYQEWIGSRKRTLVDRSVVDEMEAAFGSYQTYVEEPPEGGLEQCSRPPSGGSCLKAS